MLPSSAEQATEGGQMANGIVSVGVVRKIDTNTIMVRIEDSTGRVAEATDSGGDITRIKALETAANDAADRFINADRLMGFALANAGF